MPNILAPSSSVQSRAGDPSFVCSRIFSHLLTYYRSDMKITKVEGILMSCPLPEPLHLPFWGGERTILKRDAMLIRVTADNGLQATLQARPINAPQTKLATSSD